MRKKPSASNLRVSIISLNSDGCCWIRFKLFGFVRKEQTRPSSVVVLLDKNFVSVGIGFKHYATKGIHFHTSNLPIFVRV